MSAVMTMDAVKPIPPSDVTGRLARAEARYQDVIFDLAMAFVHPAPAPPSRELAFWAALSEAGSRARGLFCHR